MRMPGNERENGAKVGENNEKLFIIASKLITFKILRTNTTVTLAAEPSIGEMAALRRIQFEASTLMVAHVKSQVNQDAAGSDAVRKIPAAEKQQRLRDQKARLGGVIIEGETEPSYALIDLVNSMVDNNCVLWIPPSKCRKRESEIQ